MKGNRPGCSPLNWKRSGKSAMVLRTRELAGRIGLIALVLLALAPAAPAAGIDPFPTSNQSPLAQIFGLPAAGPASVLPAGNYALDVSQDIASNFAHDETSRENILLDGESYRTTLILRRGIGRDLEAG